MPRKRKEGPSGGVVDSIKEGLLREHLEKEVPNLVRTWMSELQPPHPLYYPGGWWQTPYRPPTEQNPDTNHMLRRHLRSRTLWKHHAAWEQQLDGAHRLARQVKKKAERVCSEHVKDIAQSREHSDDYLGVALWRGFDHAAGEKPESWYMASEGGKGVNYGVYQIEKSASPEEVEAVGKEHWSLVGDLARLDDMKALTRQWEQVRKSGETLQRLAEKALREHDIFQPCRFCRRLW